MRTNRFCLLTVARALWPRTRFSEVLFFNHYYYSNCSLITSCSLAACSSNPAMAQVLTFDSSKRPRITLGANNPKYCESMELTSFSIDSVSYIRRSEVARRSEERTTTSKIWDWGKALVRKKDQKEVYYCYRCERENKRQLLPILNGTKGGRDHLISHYIDPDTGLLQTSTGKKQTLYEVVRKADYTEFKTLLIQWFVFCQLAFFMVENMMFRELITCLNSALGGLLP